MENNKVTILLATHNREQLISETLNSILAQTYNNWECIIVDDHSTDNTPNLILKFIERDSRFSYYKKTDNYKKGLSGTRNYGLDLALKRGAKFIQFFDDDDIMHPEKLERQLAPFVYNPLLGFTVCKYAGFKIKSEINFFDLPSDIPIISNNLQEDFLSYKIKINSAGPIFRAKLFECERFDEELKYGEEWELFNRIFFKYDPIYLPVEQNLFYYRNHPNSITAKKETVPEKIGSQIIIMQKLWNYFKKNNLLKISTVKYFLSHFLYQYYNKAYVINVQLFLEERTDFPMMTIFKLNTLILIHEKYLKLMKFFLKK